MLHQEILSPNEVAIKLSNLSEGLFAIRCELKNKTYQIILYKYQADYFLIENPALVTVLLEKDTHVFSSPEQLLNEIEISFENNQYLAASKEWVRLDLNTLKLLNDVEIKFFSLEE
ncbi:hypothetical protein [Enterococcus viikkiensis]|uniref:hypothetical protein n=1 Tax=Enterococcus viikkiensis TaxID=930854 RepID=UPI0010F751F5|nr:hypothetical protein [Enterococcus viikkiensis]